jgi:hypothetical protein
MLGGLLALLGWGAARREGALRVALGAVTSCFGLLLGLLGCLFTLLWAFTNHEVAYRNENILQCAPFACLLAGYGIGLARGRPVAARRAHVTALAGLASATLGLLLGVMPSFSQQNGSFIAFFVPLWMGLALATRPWRSVAAKMPGALGERSHGAKPSPAS